MDLERRYQVFVSSTYLDLKAERAAVVSTLLSLEAFPAGMELFPAMDHDAWTLIEDVISDSDYYLLIIGGKYGSVDPDLDIGFTEREYDTAVQLGKPVMAFLHGEPGELLVKQSEESDVRRRKVQAFRSKVEAAKHVNYWSSPEDLAGKVATSWPKFRRHHPATGWIKADRATSTESLAALAKAQGEIEQLRAQLDKMRTEAPPGTQHLAQGDEEFVVPVSAHGRWLATGHFSWEDFQVHLLADMSWNQVFASLGLRMMQEATQRDIAGDLREAIKARYVDDLLEAVERRATQIASEKQKSMQSSHLRSLSVREEDFRTILLQLEALGLIEQSKRQRSVKDSDSYWTLTPYGKTRLVQLRALGTGEVSLRRNAVDESEPGASESQTELEDDGPQSNQAEVETTQAVKDGEAT